MHGAWQWSTGIREVDSILVKEPGSAMAMQTAIPLDPEQRIGPERLKENIFRLPHTEGRTTSIPVDGISFANNRVSFSPMGCCNSGSLYLS